MVLNGASGSWASTIIFWNWGRAVTFPLIASSMYVATTTMLWALAYRVHSSIWAWMELLTSCRSLETRT